MALGAACAFGSIATVLAPAMGIPVMGAAFTRLRLASGRSAAVVVSVLCVALAVVLGPSALVLTVSGLAVAAYAANRLRTVGAGRAALEATVTLAAALVAAEALAAYIEGTTLLAAARTAAEAAAVMASGLYGGTASAGPPVDQAALAALLLRTWPASYLFTALAAGVLLVAAVGWAGRASGVAMSRLPKLRDADMDVRILFFPVVAVALLAVGAAVSDGTPYETVALNLALASRPLFLWQGLGVIAHRLERSGIARVARVAALVVAVLLDLTLLFVSVLGLLDMWFNFRRLRRSDDRRGRSLGDEGPGTL